MKKKILVACGSGIATSTVAAERIEEICKKEGYDVEVIKGTITSVQTRQEEVDVIVTTANYTKQIDKPVINGVPFLTGINEDKTIKKLLELLEENND